MKKIIVLIAALTFTAGAYAQETKDKKMDKMDKMDQSMKDCVMMKDGKMMVMKDGKSMEMDQDMAMTNGTKVMADGKVMMKDGSTKMMKDGECVYMDGKMGKMKMKEGMTKKGGTQ